MFQSPAIDPSATNEYMDNIDLHTDQTSGFEGFGWTENSSTEVEAPEYYITHADLGSVECRNRSSERDVTSLSSGSKDALDSDDEVSGPAEDHESNTKSLMSLFSGRDVNKEKERAGEYIANELFEQVQDGRHGCTGEQH